MACIGKIVETDCPCGFRGELGFYASEDWKRDCPDCGKVLSPGTNKPQRFYGNRRFSGSECESITEGFHPKEVNLARKNMPKSAHCIREDGRVVFNDRREQREFVRELQETKRRLDVPFDPIGTNKWT